jgi:hypothetical protein
METTSANRTIRQRPRPNARCKGIEAKQTEVIAPKPVTDGFLKHRFAPMYQPAPELPERKLIERDFFKSLSYLKKHYGLDLQDLRKLPYPYNLLMAERETNRQLKTKDRYRELLIITQDDNRTCLIVKETFRREFGLYFIPVMPIYDLWQKEETKECAELLTAVCAYLYLEAGVSYYRDEDEYMFYNYESLEGWIEDDKDCMDKEDFIKLKEAYKNAKEQGDFMQSKMMTEGLLARFQKIITGFKDSTGLGLDCLSIAKTALQIRKDFPHRNLYQHCSAPKPEEEDDYYYDNNFVGMNEYISFIGCGRDRLSDDLFNMANTDFNERPSFQEPELLTFFNERKGKYADGLAYEHHVFNLIDDLCTLLYQIS